jgi:outer membrane receptor protein involved in Fe transport
MAVKKIINSYVSKIGINRMPVRSNSSISSFREESLPLYPGNKIIVFILLCFSLLASSNRLNAQDKPKQTAIDPYELSLEQLGKIVITASKTPQSVTKVTQKVDVVTEKQMKQIVQGNRNLAELIQYIPGASVKVLSRNDVNWGAYGGIGPKYNTYMLQGLPIDGFVDPMSMEAMAIQRIEIQRGPASVLYPNYLSQDFAGNQSPLAGTVNLILIENISKPQSLASFSFGSYNTFTGKIYHENRFGKVQLFVGSSFEKSDYTNYGSSGSWLNMQKNPQYKKGKAILGASVFLDNLEKHKISIFGNYTFHQGDVGRVNREYDNLYGLMNLEYAGQLTDSLKIAFKAGLRTYDRSWQEDNFSTNNDQSLRETDGVKQTIVPVDLSLTYHHFQFSNLPIGADYQYASYLTTAQLVNQSKSTGNDASVSQAGIYFQEELQLDKLTVRGGARYNLIDYIIEKLSGTTPGFKTQSWNVILWSAGTKYRLNEDWSVYANAGSSFMPPGLKSIGGTLSVNDQFVAGKNGQLPNPDLKPESGIGFDLGLEGRILSSVYFSVRAFNSKITDAIIDNVISNNPSQTMSENADGKTQVKGFEISIKQLVDKKLDWFANLTLSKSEIVDPNHPDQDGIEIPFVPKVMGNLGFTLYLPHSIEISPMAHFGGRIYDSNSKATRMAFDSKELVNIIVSKVLIMNDNNKLNVFVKFYNITNNRFDMPWGFRDPGFNYTMGARITF